MDCIRWVLDEAKWPVTPADLVQPVTIEPTYAVGRGRPDGFRITVAGAIVVTANIPNHTADIVLDGQPVHPDDRAYRTSLYVEAIAHLRCMGVLPSEDSRFIMPGRYAAGRLLHYCHAQHAPRCCAGLLQSNLAPYPVYS